MKLCFSPSLHDEIYKLSQNLPWMAFYYLVTIVVVAVVLYLVLNYFSFDWSQTYVLDAPTVASYFYKPRIVLKILFVTMYYYSSIISSLHFG
jgi:hypothetical protein